MYLRIEPDAFEQATTINEETQNPVNLETNDEVNNLAEASPDDE